MARKSKQESEQEVVNAVTQLIKDAQRATWIARSNALENFQMFVAGSQFSQKQDWQADFSINEFGASIRTAAANVRSNFLRRPNWFLMRGLTDTARQYQSSLEKLLRFHLGQANFRRVANTALLCSNISMGIVRVGWKQERIKNPRVTIRETRKEIDEFNKAVAGTVDNPKATTFDLLEASPEQLDALVDSSVKDIIDFSTKPKFEVQKEVIPQFAQRGVLELTPINFDNFYYDPYCTYIENSSWVAMEDWVPLWKLKEMEAIGAYKNVDKIDGSNRPPDLYKKALYDQIYKGTATSSVDIQRGLVKVVEYFGPIIIADQITEHYQHVVIANDSILLMRKTNPFWADGQDIPFVCASAHEVPFRASGAGIADNAKKLQYALDSNLHLMIDQSRLGIVGLNIINKAKLKDPSSTEEGIEPGKFIEAIDDPDKVFKHYNLTSNVENQVLPMNEILRQGIQKVTGVNNLLQGGNAPRSRTSAAEIQQVSQGSDLSLYTVAEDIEIGLLLPMLKKSFARVIQYMDLSDPALKAHMSDDELFELQHMGEEQRFNDLMGYYQFEINGFTNDATRFEQIKRLNELLALYNTGGPLSTIIKGGPVVRELIELYEFSDPDKYINSNNEFDRLDAENNLLMKNQMVQVLPNDNHQMHIQKHQMLTNVTQAQMMHLQQHQMYLQQITLANQISQGQNQPQGQATDSSLGESSEIEKALGQLQIDSLEQ